MDKVAHPKIMQTLTQVEDLNLINERLERLYGRHIAVPKATFRVVFADDQYEKREGTFTVTTESGVFVREESGIKEVKKYPFFEGCWVVERLVANVLPDVIEGDYVYEPVYAFNIFPSWRAVEFLLAHLFGRVKGQAEERLKYKDQKACDDTEREILQKEKEWTKNRLDLTPLETSLNDKSALSYTNTKGIDYRPSKQENQNG